MKVKKYLNNEPFAFTYGDGVSDINLNNLISHHNKSNKLVTLTAIKPPGRYGAINSKVLVISFQEKPQGEQAWINGGFFIVDYSAIDFITDFDQSWEFDILPKIASNDNLSAYLHNGFWLPMDTLRDKQKLEKLWENNDAPWKKMEIENLIFWKDKKVLITGHNGFKGSWLTTWLLSLGANIFGYSLDIEKNSLYENLNFELQNEKTFGSILNKEGNINEFKNICSFVNEVKPDIVFHLAAQPLVKESYKDPLRTWNTNVIGTLNLLESLKQLSKKCAVVLITTDKVYKNKEWIYGYREIDELGGKDPYSASKAAMELAINSWISSFCGNKNYQTDKLEIASARSGNVIGGGDFSKDRIVPDLVKSIFNKDSLLIRNPNARRPWLHVLEPLSGYLVLAERLYKKSTLNKK